MAGTCDRFEPRLLQVNGTQAVSCFLYQQPDTADASQTAEVAHGQ